jgi:hypothetical protein
MILESFLISMMHSIQTALEEGTPIPLYSLLMSNRIRIRLYYEFKAKDNGVWNRILLDALVI